MTQAELWSSLAGELCRWFHDPDLDGVRIVLSAVASHYYQSEKPVWLLVLGEPSSGKTETGIQPLAALPGARIIGALTPSCFLSAWAKGKESWRNSLLGRDAPAPANGLITSSAIWLAKDFTTFGSMRPDLRLEVGSHLREIWDGDFVRDTGVGPSLRWSGKITLIAAATPELERHWAVMRGLGERFLTLRWTQPDRQGAIVKSRAQLGNEKLIRSTLQAMVRDLVMTKNFTSIPTPDPGTMSTLDSLAGVVATLRVHVPRESDTSRSILAVPRPELPTRISMALYQIARTHAAMLAKPAVDDQDLALARRLAVDSIPDDRRRILTVIPPGRAVSFGEILELTEIPRTTLGREMENLIAIGVLAKDLGHAIDWSATRTELTPKFRSELSLAGLRLHNQPVPTIISSNTRRTT